MEYAHRAWLEIDIDIIVENLKKLSALAKNAAVMPVIKSDAYSHNAVEVALATQDLDLVKYFGVACFDEALALRKAGIEKPILIFGYTPVSLTKELAENNLTQTVHFVDYAKELSQALKVLNKTLDIHIKIDTGMSRIGLITDAHDLAPTLDEIEQILKEENLNATGMYTHFADSENTDTSYCDLQQSIFVNLIEALSQKGISLQYNHSCNSGGLLYHPEYALDMVRVGFAMYGRALRDDSSVFGLEIAKSFKALVAQVKTLKKGTTIGYSRTAKLEKDTKIAVLNVGYSDDYSRNLSNKAEVLIKGKRAKILGNVCMDTMMVDVSTIEDVCVGDIATLLGKDNDDCIDIIELAKHSKESPYALLATYSHRTPRVYKKMNTVYKVEK